MIGTRREVVLAETRTDRADEGTPTFAAYRTRLRELTCAGATSLANEICFQKARSARPPFWTGIAVSHLETKP